MTCVFGRYAYEKEDVLTLSIAGCFSRVYLVPVWRGGIFSYVYRLYLINSVQKMKGFFTSPFFLF